MNETKKSIIVDYIIDNFEALQLKCAPYIEKKQHWYKQSNPLLHDEVKEQYISEVRRILTNDITDRHPSVTIEDVMSNITDSEIYMIFGERV